MYVGLLSTFLLLWLHPALGEGRGGRGGEGSAASDRGEGEEGVRFPDLLGKSGNLTREEEEELGSEKVTRGEKQCVRRVVMEERRVPRQVFF